MKLKDVGRKVALGIATAGLSSCNVGCDPVPPPVECSYATGDLIYAYGTSQDQARFKLSVGVDFSGTVSDVVVSDLVGARLVSTGPGGGDTVDLVFERTAAAAGDGGGAGDGGNSADAGAGGDMAAGALEDAGSFTVQLVYHDDKGMRCTLKRAFRWSVSDGSGQVQISRALPLGTQKETRIEVVRRDEHTVHLRARSPLAGEERAEWSVTGGAIVEASSRHAVWQLPAEPGLYQVELVLDYGDSGFSVDAIALEVA